MGIAQGDALKKQFADIIPSELLRLDWVAETSTEILERV